MYGSRQYGSQALIITTVSNDVVIVGPVVAVTSTVPAGSVTGNINVSIAGPVVAVTSTVPAGSVTGNLSTAVPGPVVAGTITVPVGAVAVDADLFGPTVGGTVTALAGTVYTVLGPPVPPPATPAIVMNTPVGFISHARPVSQIVISGSSVLNYSPGVLLVNLASGPPYAQVGIKIDSGPVLVTVTLDGTGAATGVSVPVNTTVGTHTMNVVTA